MRNIIGVILICAGVVFALGSVALDYFSKSEAVATTTNKPLKLAKPSPTRPAPKKPQVAAKKADRKIKMQPTMTEVEYDKKFVRVYPKCNHCGGK